VDSVREVLKLPTSLIKPTAELGTLIDEAFVWGVAQKDEQLIVLIDLQGLFDDDEHDALDTMETV
jgi:chemotaxis signal transduction protein